MTARSTSEGSGYTGTVKKSIVWNPMSRSTRTLTRSREGRTSTLSLLWTTISRTNWDGIPITGGALQTGNITGRISTRSGAASEGVSVTIDSLLTKALLFDGYGGYVAVRDADAAFGFTASNSYTIETWVRYLGDGGSGEGDGTMISGLARRGRSAISISTRQQAKRRPARPDLFQNEGWCGFGNGYEHSHRLQRQPVASRGGCS